MTRTALRPLGTATILLLGLTGCSIVADYEQALTPEDGSSEATQAVEDEEPAADGTQDEDLEAEPAVEANTEDQSLPDVPQAYSPLTVIGDEDALPQGDAGEVSVVTISEPESNTSFPFILQNRTDQPISRVEVGGRAVDGEGHTLGTGSSHGVTPNVVLPGEYGFGYVYIDTSEWELPAGASIPDLRIDFTDGLGSYENIIGLDIENFEQLSSGDLTGDVANPHDVPVSGPISIETICLADDGQVTDRSSFADSDSVSAGSNATWTISSYRDTPECVTQLISASGFER